MRSFSPSATPFGGTPRGSQSTCSLVRRRLAVGDDEGELDAGDSDAAITSLALERVAVASESRMACVEEQRCEPAIALVAGGQAQRVAVAPIFVGHDHVLEVAERDLRQVAGIDPVVHPRVLLR